MSDVAGGSFFPEAARRSDLARSMEAAADEMVAALDGLIGTASRDDLLRYERAFEAAHQGMSDALWDGLDLLGGDERPLPEVRLTSALGRLELIVIQARKQIEDSQ